MGGRGGVLVARWSVAGRVDHSPRPGVLTSAWWGITAPDSIFLPPACSSSNSSRSRSPGRGGGGPVGPVSGRRSGWTSRLRTADAACLPACLPTDSGVRGSALRNGRCVGSDDRVSRKVMREGQRARLWLSAMSRPVSQKLIADPHVVIGRS